MRKYWAALGLISVATFATSAANAQFTQHWVTTLPFHQRLDKPTGGATVDDDIRGIAFNKNVGSPYYGYAYVCFNAAQPGNVRYDKILIYKPNATAAAHGVPSYEDTGLSIISPGHTSNSTFGVDIGSDDTVWLVDYSGRKVLTAPPVPTSGSESTATVVIDLANFDGTATPLLPTGITGVGNPRAVAVSGPATNATVVVCNWASSTKRSIEHFTVTGSGATFNWIYSPTSPAGNTYSQSNSCVDAAIDKDGNVYVPLGSSGAVDPPDVTIVKLSPSGVVDSSFAPTAPAGASPSDYPAIAYVPNASAPGGGYLFWEGSRNGTSSANFYQYDMTGARVDAYGVTNAGDPLGLGKFILNQGTYEVLSPDGEGNLYFRRTGSSEGVIYRISQSPPALNAGAYSKSAPTVYNGVMYFGSADGGLHAVDTTTGEELTGFPMDVASATEDTGPVVLGRPSVYFPDGGNGGVFFVTSKGRVVRMPLTSSAPVWVSSPLTASSDTMVVATPAVTSDAVYVPIAEDGVVTLFKVDVADGIIGPSVQLGEATSVMSSPVVAPSGDIYVTTDKGTFRINSSMVVQSGTEGDNASGSPFVDVHAPGQPTMYVAENAGVVRALNATNFQSVASFGAGGAVTLTDGTTTYPLMTGPYALKGKVYVGARDNKVYALNESDGSGAGDGGSMVFFDANAVGIPVAQTAPAPNGWQIKSDVSAAPAAGGGWNIVFGSRNGQYYQVSETDPTQYHVTVVGNVNKYAVDGPPAIDRDTNSEFVGVDSGFIMKIPAFGVFAG